MTCPGCGTTLEGLGTYCHACESYVDALPTPGGTATAPSPPQVGPRPPETVLVLPLISQNAMWRSVPGTRKGMAETAAAYLAGEVKWKAVLDKLYAKMTVSREGRAYKRSAAEWLACQRTHLYTDCEVRLLVTLYLPRRVGDTDNYLKPMLDALEGVLFEDDRVVSELHVVRRYDKASPRAVVVCQPDDGSTTLDPGATFQYDMGF